MSASRAGLNGTPLPPRGHPRADLDVGQGLTAAEPGAQHGVSGGGVSEPLRVTAVLAVWVGGAGGSAPGRVHLVVGQAGPGHEAQRPERIPGDLAAHWPGSGPKASSSRALASGSGDGRGPERPAAGPAVGAATGEDVLTEDVLTEDALTEDALTEDVLTEDALTEDALSEDAAGEGGVGAWSGAARAAGAATRRFT
jgi:hypothetical protein